MQQGNFIAGALVIAFLVFITLKGELAAYLDLIRGVSSGIGGSGALSSNGGLTMPDLPDLPSIASKVGGGLWSSEDQNAAILDIFGGGR